MKSLLLVFLLGFCSHKAVSFAYEYSFWYNDRVCKREVANYNDLSVDDQLECIYNHMGMMKDLEYLLYRPVYMFSEVSWGS